MPFSETPTTSAGNNDSRPDFLPKDPRAAAEALLRDQNNDQGELKEVEDRLAENIKQAEAAETVLKGIYQQNEAPSEVKTYIEGKLQALRSEINSDINIGKAIVEAMKSRNLRINELLARLTQAGSEVPSPTATSSKDSVLPATPVTVDSAAVQQKADDYTKLESDAFASDLFTELKRRAQEKGSTSLSDLLGK
jgi:hypothetical protein